MEKEFTATTELIPGSNGVYDVIVDEKIIFSKHTANRFPEEDEIISLIKF